MIFVVDDVVDVAGDDIIDDILVEVFGCFGAAALVPFDAAQVVDDVAAGPDEVAFFAERGEFLAEFCVVVFLSIYKFKILVFCFGGWFIGMYFCGRNSRGVKAWVWIVILTND